MSLTRHKEGSLRELWSISFPLMLSYMSGMVMLFVDRLFLAHLSPAAHNAAVQASTLGWAFCLSWITLAGISEVFVAQNHGAGNHKKLGEPVWQMIWLGIASVFFFVPMAIWFGPLVYGTSAETVLQRGYLFWMLLFGPSFALYGAISGFFIAQGRVRLITVVALSTNCINALLDRVLIFGVEGWIPSFGIEGAAIATSLSQVIQVIALGTVFLSKNNRVNYGTVNWRFSFKPFWNCLKIGVPSAVFVFLEIMAWAMYYGMLNYAGNHYITIGGICQNLLILFYFFCDGLSKGATTIVGNLIGAGKQHLVSKVIWSGVQINFFFFVGLFLFVFFFQDDLASLFLPFEENLETIWLPTLSTCLYLAALYLSLDGLRFLFSGVLTAAGDTRFLMISGAISIWIFLVFPVYFIVIQGGASIVVAQSIAAFYAAMLSIICAWRFKQGKWKEISILQEKPSKTT